MNGIFLETNEQSDVLSSLEEFERQITRVAVDVDAWKYAIISLMFAVTGALVCFLNGTMNTGALKKKNAIDTVAALQKDSGLQQPRPYLASPEELLERASSDERYDTVREKLTVSQKETSSFKLMVNMRNQFTHFAPTGWSIEISGLPERSLDIIEIIRKISSNGWAFRHLEPEEKERISKVMVAIDIRLRLLAEEYQQNAT